MDLVGSFRLRTSDHPARVPILIRWNPLTSRYEITAPIWVRPRIGLAGSHTTTRTWQDLDTHRFLLRDRRSGRTIAGYSTSAFNVVPQASANSYALLVSGYPLAPKRAGEQWQITGYQLDVEHRNQFQCPARPVPVGEGLSRWVGVTDHTALALWRRAEIVC